MTRAALLAALLPRWRAVLTERLGLHFDPRQDDWLSATLGQLAQADDGATPAAFLARLERQTTRADLDAMAAALTVGETFFFRHPEQFDALRTVALPDWQRRMDALPPTVPRRLRALSAGCASGEESYTLAITLQRAGLEARGVDWNVTAFDLNAAVVARAVAARYGEWSLRATSPAARELWFRRVDEAWTPLPSIRQRVRFEQRHIARADPAFWTAGAFDVIFCRNMLMYLDEPTLRRAIGHLVTALAPGGVLFLGHAETLRGLTDRLILRRAHDCFYYQAPVAGESPRAALAAPDPQAAPLPHTAIAPGKTWPSDHGVVQPPHHAPRAVPTPPAEVVMPVDPASMALLDEALLLIEAGQLDDGLRACASLEARPLPAPLQAELFFLQALALEERGELPAADWHLQRAAGRDAAFAMPHLRLGLLARRRGEPVAARRELRQALALLDDETDERLRRYGGGFERDALRRLCRQEIGEALA